MSAFATAILWAIIGASSYKIISTISNIGRHTIFAKNVVYHCLTLMGAVVEDLAFIRELKYLQMSKSDMSDEQVKFIKKVDEQTLDNWKEGSIKIFKNSFPSPLDSIIKFRDWKSAMAELDKLHKRG